MNEPILDMTDNHTAIIINTSSSLKSHLKCHFDIYQGLLEVVNKSFEHHHLPVIQHRAKNIAQFRYKILVGHVTYWAILEA